MGKGSGRRPPQISREEEELRWELARGLITKEMFDTRYNELMAAGRITRSGKVARHGDIGGN